MTHSQSKAMGAGFFTLLVVVLLDLLVNTYEARRLNERIRANLVAQKQLDALEQQVHINTALMRAATQPSKEKKP